MLLFLFGRRCGRGKAGVSSTCFALFYFTRCKWSVGFVRAFCRRDTSVWQFIAGGGETGDACTLDSAKREAWEEARIPFSSKYTQLQTTCSIAAECFKNAAALWGERCFVIPEYAFAVMVQKQDLAISDEHTEYMWADYETARRMLRYDSNRVALYELNSRLRMGLV